MVRLPLVLQETPGEQERCGGLGMHWAAGAAPWQVDGPGSTPGYTHLLVYPFSGAIRQEMVPLRSSSDLHKNLEA